MKPTNLRNSTRRNVLRLLGAGAVGTAAVGTASAGETGDNRRQDSYAWANNTLYEMLESEPHPIDKDNEGNDAGHRPLWVIAMTGLEHSPHPAPGNPPIDHVIPIGGGGQFTAQWHVHLVLDGENPWDEVGGERVPNFVNEFDGDLLTSASRIQAAHDADAIHLVETPTVFTCPVRPHNHR